MPGPIAACFRCAAAAAAASPTSGAGAAGPSLATSVYETHLGLVALSWSRASLGLSLRAVLRLSPPSTPGSSSSAASGAGYLDDDADDEETTLAFRVRPWLLWRRRGSRRFRAGDRLVDLAWDLSRARFQGSGSPEPSSGFFVAVVVDGEMVLAAGDLPDAAYRQTRAQRPPGPRPVLLSRREHVSLRDAGAGRGRSHTTWVTVQGKEREISVDLVARGRGRDKGATGRGKEREKERADVGMSVSVDGERVLHVRRLRWKFRGSERVDLGGGDGVQVSWDLHNWLFPPVLVRYLGEETDKCPLSGAVSLCNPFNLVIADEDFHKGFNNVYDRALARALRTIFKKHALLFEDMEGEYDIPKAANARTVRDFDEGLTRVSFGFKSVDDYYSNSSSSDSIKNVRIPLLCIQADNDPIAPSRGIPREDIKANPNCLLIVTPQGGHLGWVAGDEAPFGCPWTDPIVMEYLEYLQNEKRSSAKNNKSYEQQGVSEASEPHLTIHAQR